MAQSWPSSLPPWPYVKVQPKDNYIRSTTDTGPGKTRRRTTGDIDDLSFTLTMNGAQLQTLLGMYDDSLEFEHDNPLDDTLATYRFKQKPQYQSVAGAPTASERIWNVQINLMKLP